MRRRAGPLEVGLTPRCALPAPQPGHLSRVFKGDCKSFHRNFSGMADLINFMAGNHKTLLLQIDARLLFMRSHTNKIWRPCCNRDGCCDYCTLESVQKMYA